VSDVESIGELISEGATHAGDMMTAGARLGQNLAPFELPGQLAVGPKVMKQMVLFGLPLLFIAFMRCMPTKTWKFCFWLWLVVVAYIYRYGA